MHGSYMATVMPIQNREVCSGCPSCMDSQKKAISKNARLKINACDQTIPDRFRGVSFSDMRAANQSHEKIIRASQRYAEKFSDALRIGHCLFFIGSYGTGKTSMACAIAREVYSRGYRVTYSRVLDLIDSIKDKTFRQKLSEHQALNSFTQTDLLIVDEFGVQRSSEYELMILTEILSRRDDAKKPTIFISNLNLSGVKEIIGDRVFDRVRGSSSIFACEWPSFRPQNFKEVIG